jgi:hypothetical protein
LGPKPANTDIGISQPIREGNKEDPPAGQSQKVAHSDGYEYRLTAERHYLAVVRRTPGRFSA